MCSCVFHCLSLFKKEAALKHFTNLFVGGICEDVATSKQEPEANTAGFGYVRICGNAFVTALFLATLYDIGYRNYMKLRYLNIFE